MITYDYFNDYAFSHCDNLVLWVYENSYAQEYAEDNGIKYQFIS
jgi:hypothetical protein